ncbi:uncharacterized protein [Nicotiana sylvestris]|uniref:uncharacterized protein n=1 Tax=Nicotiana sylvestris TaxID=4096 RepID=UPI00388CBDD3
MADYEVIDQLRKFPAQVSLLSLLMNSTEHQKVLIKTLNEAYVPVETSVEQLERMAERFFAINQISFSKNNLPPEGAAYKKALHLTVKCEGYYMKRVMLDGGLGPVRRGKPLPQSFISNASIMVAKEMIIHGFKSGMGLGKSLQGITELVALTASETFFGIGFRPTPADVKWANNKSNDGWVLPQPVPHLYITFVKPKHQEEEEYEAFTAEEIEGICGAMRKILYETHMVQPGECISTAEVLYMGPDAKLQNWNATPFLIRRESCFEKIRETKISIHTDEKTRDALIQLLFEFKDVFAWSCDDMPGLSVDLVVHKLPTYPDCPQVQQKQRKFKTDISDKIKEEVTKQLKAGVIRVVRYTTWLANVVQCQRKTERPRVMPFGLKNVGATYMRAMAAIFHDMMHHEIEVYVDDICERFKITHRNSTPYRPKANGVVEAANKNIKKILRKMIQSSRQWHEKLSFPLLGYRATVRTSIGATPYLLIYGTEAVIPAEVEIPSLQIIVEAEIEDSEWVKTCLEQLTLIDEKQMVAVCHGQLYQQRMARAYSKKVRPRNFEVGQLVLRCILPHHQEAKGKFTPNWKGPYIIRKILPKGALYLGDIEGNDPEAAVNADRVKRYYV